MLMLIVNGQNLKTNGNKQANTKLLKTTHMCPITIGNKQESMKLWTKNFISLFRNTPNKKLGALQNETKTRWEMMLSI